MKRRLFLAILVMVAGFAVTVVACKKETQNELFNKSQSSSKALDMRQIDDLGAYLKDFRQKMLEGNSNETFNLDDAAWLLASLANYEHCNVNVPFDDVRFDSIYMQVNLTDGGVMMSDLRTAYEQMWPAIKKFQDGLGLNYQNLRFVNMSISDDGKASITMMTTFFSEEKDLGDHLWFFPNDDYLDSICDIFFENGLLYQWNTAACKWLTSATNVLEGNLYDPNHPQSSCYAPTRSYMFYYNYWIDPYGTSFYYNSRLFSYLYNTVGVPNFYLDKDKMCYCLDSYLGLGFDWLEDNPGDYENERPVYWTVIPDTLENIGIICHKLKVQYGRPFGGGGVGPNPN